MSLQAVFIPHTASFDKDQVIEKALEKDINDINFTDHVNGLSVDETVGKLLFVSNCYVHYSLSLFPFPYTFVLFLSYV
jgi:hypothetical protein